MKLKRTIIAGTTAIAAVVAMSATSVSTFAGTHNNVNSGTQIESIFNTDTDTEVIINLSGNIEELKELKAGVGQKYTINGKEYIIKSVVVISGGGDDGDRKGEVIINSDIKSENNALVTRDKVNVTVNGDVTAENGTGVTAGDESVVQINGNVKGKMGVRATAGEESAKGPTVTVEENVEVRNAGVGAMGKSVVTVKGNVDAGAYGVMAVGGEEIGESTVTVKGDVDAGAYGVVAEGKTTVTVEGDVDAGVAGVLTYGELEGEGPTVTVMCDVSGKDGNPDEVDDEDPYSSSDGGNGVVSYGVSNVTVGGNVSGGKGYGTLADGGYGVTAYGPSNVTVKGNVTGGNVEANAKTKNEEEYGNYAGNGVDMDNYAKVTVYGDVTGGSTNADKGGGGAGAYISLVPYDFEEGEERLAKGKLYVQGTISGGESTGTDGESRAGIEYSTRRMKDMLASYVEEEVDEILDMAPVVTTWKVESGGEDVSPIIADLGEAIAEALNDQHNYLVRINSSENGTVEIDNPTYNPGDTIIITPTPNDGYKLVSVMVNGEEITPVDGVYSYVMPEYGGVEISAVFTAIEKETADDTEEVKLNSGVELAKDVSTKSTTPETGDSSKSTVWSVITLIATGGIVSGIVALHKKRKNNR